MIEIKDKKILMKGNVKEVLEELNELKEIYGNITIGELIERLYEKWK